MIYGLPDKLVELVFNVCKMAKLLQIQCLLICKHYAINPKSALKERIQRSAHRGHPLEHVCTNCVLKAKKVGHSANFENVVRHGMKQNYVYCKKKQHGLSEKGGWDRRCGCDCEYLWDCLQSQQFWLFFLIITKYTLGLCLWGKCSSNLSYYFILYSPEALPANKLNDVYQEKRGLFEGDVHIPTPCWSWCSVIRPRQWGEVS